MTASLRLTRRRMPPLPVSPPLTSLFGHTPTGNSQPCVRRRYDAGDGPEFSDRCVPAKPCLVNPRHLLKVELTSRSI